MTSVLLDAALDYAARGWPVLPLHSPRGTRCSCGRSDCTSPAKHPRTGHGLIDATTDADQVAAWWAQWPNANIGLRTGVAFDVLDVDGDDGYHALVDFCTDMSIPLPLEAPCSFTGGGGQHLLFAPIGHGNRAGVLRKVDWRGTNGYIVAPPSIHLSGQSYRWADNDFLLHPPPAPLRLLVDPPKVERPAGDATNGRTPIRDGDATPYGRQALDAELAELRRAAEGTRNHTLNAAAFNLYQLVAGGELDETAVEDALRATAAAIGLGDHETTQTLTSARAAGMADPRAAPERPALGGKTAGYDPPPPPGDTDQPDEDRPPLSLLERIQAATYIGDDIKNLPPPSPLVEGWLDLDTLAVLYGPSGAGKSFLALDYSLSVSTGSWWNNSAVTQGPVVYVAAEGATGLGIRVTSWEAHNHTYSAGDIRWVTIPINLMTPDWTAAMVEYVAAIRPVLVVFDTLARSMVGGDENLARDTGIVIDNAERVRRACQACVLIVHHSGKDEAAGARGSSALKAAVNTEIECKGADGVVYVKSTKQKDSVSGDQLRLALTVVGDSCVLTRYRGLSLDSLPSGAIQMLRDLLAIVDEEGVSSSRWLRSTDVAERSFYRWQKILVEQGLTAKHGRGTQARYIPTQQGVQAVQETESD